MKHFVILAVVSLLMHALPSSAQKVSISSNLLDYACLGTLNAEVSVSVSQHWCATLGARYNPFTFHKGDAQNQFQCRQQSYSAGFRVWPWHSFSGWWFAGKLRYQEYNFGGLFSRETEEGDRGGMGLYSGYTHMLSQHFNIEIGVGLWGGAAWYRKYSCPACGFTVERGRKLFLLPDDIMISVAYVF